MGTLSNTVGESDNNSREDASVKCKCGKKATVALNGQWFCLDCLDKGVEDAVQIVKRSIKGFMKSKRKRT